MKINNITKILLSLIIFTVTFITVSTHTKAACAEASYCDAAPGTCSTTANGGFSIRCIKDSTNQINKLNYNINVQIYPNPSNDIVYINYTENKIIKMQVYNTIGECILQKILNKGINDFDISSLSKGIYIVKLTGSDWTSQTKLIKK